MREAKISEVNARVRPLLVAHLTVRELLRWFPVRLRRVPHPFEAAEMCQAALIQLDAGPYVLLHWGEATRQLMLHIPATTDGSEVLCAFLREVPLPCTRILWLDSNAVVPEWGCGCGAAQITGRGRVPHRLRGVPPPVNGVAAEDFRKRRQAMGLSRSALAAALGITTVDVIRCEREGASRVDPFVRALVLACAEIQHVTAGRVGGRRSNEGLGRCASRGASSSERQRPRQRRQITPDLPAGCSVHVVPNETITAATGSR